MLSGRAYSSACRILTAVGLVALFAIGPLSCGREAKQGSSTPGKVPITHPGEPGWPTDLPGTATLPFPPTEVEKARPVGRDKTLIVHREGETVFDVCYLLASNGRCEPIVGAARRAEVRSISPTVIEFTCHGTNDTAFVAFPYLLIYDVVNGKAEERHLYWDPHQAVEFGFPGVEKGQVLTSIGVEKEGLSLEFATSEEALETYGGPISYVPYTAVHSGIPSARD